jgi:hypothetical protein
MSVVTSFFKDLFGGPPPPPSAPPPPPHPATMGSAAVQQAGQQAAAGAAAASGMGFGDTIKTGTLGAPKPATTGTDLLGGA